MNHIDIDCMRSELAAVQQSHARLRRIVVGLGLSVTLVFLLGAATAVQIINGDLTVTGDLKCANVSTEKAEIGELNVKKNLAVSGTVNDVDIKVLKQTVGELSTKCDSLEKTLSSIRGRNIAEEKIIPMGEFAGNGEQYWQHDFDADVLAVTGFVQDTDGGYKPLVGDCKAHTIGVSTQRIDGGKLRVRVAFNPRYNKLPFAFVCVVLKKGG